MRGSIPGDTDKPVEDAASSASSIRFPSSRTHRDTSPTPLLTSAARQRFASSPRVPPLALPRTTTASEQDTISSLASELGGGVSALNCGTAGSVSGGGTVTLERTKLLKETSQQQENALTGLHNEQRRLVQLQRDVVEVQRQNEELRQQLATHDVRALRETNAQLQAAADEVVKLQATKVQLQATIDRRGAVQAELEALRPAVAETQALENELREFKLMDARRDGLRREIAGMQSKAEIVSKLKRQLVQLQLDVAETESLSAQVAAMAAQAEKLPALKVLHAKKQASSAEARHLERSIAELEKQEAQYSEMAARLPVLQAKVADFEELKTRVDSAQEAVRATEALKARLTELSRTAALLPSLQAEHTRLADAAAQAQALDKQVMALMPAAAQLQSVKYQHQQLTAAVAEVAAMQARVAELKDVEAQRAALVRQLEELGARDEGALEADLRGMERAVSHRLTPLPPALLASMPSASNAASLPSRLELPQVPESIHEGRSSGGGSGRSNGSSMRSLPGLALDDVAAAPPQQLSPESGQLSQRQQAVEALQRQLQALQPQVPVAPVPSFRRVSSGGGAAAARAERSARASSSGGAAAPATAAAAAVAAAVDATAGAKPPLAPTPEPPTVSAFTSAVRIPPAGTAAERSVRDLASLHEAAAMLQELEGKRHNLKAQLEALGPGEASRPQADKLRARLSELEEEHSMLQSAASEVVIMEEASVGMDGEYPRGASGSPGAGRSSMDDGRERDSGGARRAAAPVVVGATSVAALRSQFSGDVRIPLTDLMPRMTAMEEQKARSLQADNERLSAVASQLPQLQEEHARLKEEAAQAAVLEAQLKELKAQAARRSTIERELHEQAEAEAAAAVATEARSVLAAALEPPLSEPLQQSTLELQRRYEELAPLEAEAVMLAAEVQRLAPLRGAIGVVREEHAHLIALLHEHNRLEADAAVLRMQVASVSRRGSVQSIVEAEVVTSDDTDAAGDNSFATPGSDFKLATARSKDSGGADHEVFLKLREVTAERLELLEENDALQGEVEDLRERLAASVLAINKLKTIASAVQNIREVGSKDKHRSVTTGGSYLG